MESCKLLVGAGADITAADNLGRTPAALAKEMGLVDMMHYLENSGVRMVSNNCCILGTDKCSIP